MAIEEPGKTGWSRIGTKWYGVVNWFESSSRGELLVVDVSVSTSLINFSIVRPSSISSSEL